MLALARTTQPALPQLLGNLQQHAACWFATTAAAASGKPGAKPAAPPVAVVDWKAVKLPADVAAPTLPTTTLPGQAFVNDLRSTSGLGTGDGIKNHTDKWLQGASTSPLQYIQAAEPIKVSGTVVASYGSDDPALGCPVEYISLKGTSKERPAVCKYTGNKYYSDDWMHGH